MIFYKLEYKNYLYAISVLEMFVKKTESILKLFFYIIILRYYKGNLYFYFDERSFIIGVSYKVQFFAIPFV